MSWVIRVPRIFSFSGVKLLVTSLVKEELLPLSAALVGLVSKTVVFPGAESCPEEKEAGRREEYFEAVAILFS
jgi:hypothetical protein